jgi:hypothetical protein
MKCVYTGRFEGAARHAFWCEDFCALERVSLRNRSVSMEIAFCEFRLLIVCIRPCRHYGAGDKSPKAARFGVGATTLADVKDAIQKQRTLRPGQFYEGAERK